MNIRRDVPYSVVDGETLTIDLYYPPEWPPGAHTPAVLFVTGYSDVGMQAMLGCKAKEMASYVSWGELVAASGMVAITYEARQPTADLQAVLQYAHQRAGPLGMTRTGSAYGRALATCRTRSRFCCRTPETP